tara:strand:+ start:4455 stop:4733 length:279 start_codon:yes stop_codon:yes gene_type:complete
MILNNIQIGLIQFIITCCFFYIEALLHFNIGKTGGKLCCKFPKLKDNIKIVCIIATFASLSTIATYLIKKKLTNNDNNNDNNDNHENDNPVI